LSKTAWVQPDIIRLSSGIEHMDDFEQALEASAA